MFTRQCALLFLLKKPAELIQRALDYLHNTVQEIKALEVWKLVLYPCPAEAGFTIFENTVNPDQLAFYEAIRSRSTLFSTLI